jgi:hypothetical protein
MKKICFLAPALILGALLIVSISRADGDVPATRWLNGVKGLTEAREIQRQAGADILVYFASYNSSDQAGLCHWFENGGLGQQAVAKYLRDFIKVKIILPLNRDDSNAVADFRVNKCPAVFIVPPSGWHKRCAVFDWSQSRPQLLSPADLVQLFRSNSSAGNSATNSVVPALPE